MKTKIKALALMVTLSCTFLSGCVVQEPPVPPDEILPLTKEGLAGELRAVNDNLLLMPYDVDLRTKKQNLTEELATRSLQEAENALALNDFDRAAALWQEILAYQPGNSRARQGLNRIESWRALEKIYKDAVDLRTRDPEMSLQKVQKVLEEDPNWPQATLLRDYLLREIAIKNQPETRLNRSLRKTISLNFREHNLMAIFETISELTGVNIIFDKDVSPSETASLVARDTTAEDAIKLLMLSNQLSKKILNDNTLLIYPANQQKEKLYRDVVLKTVFLGYTRAKDVNVALRNLVKLRDIHVDERTNSITMRGSRESVEKAERLLMTLDRPEAEVTLAVEVLEVFSRDIENLGVQYPQQIGIGFNGGDGQNIPLKGFNLSNMFVNLGAARGIQINLDKMRSNARVLANPRIRVKNNKKALVEIGERIPVITSTITESGFSQEKVEYQEVGLKLEVTPEISTDSNIAMDVDFTLSSVGQAEKSKDNVSYYRTNERVARTVLSSRNGETQMLAGLIRKNDNDTRDGLPGLSEIPGLGRIFGTSNRTKENTEVVLLITPMIERSIDLPGSHISTIEMGTEDSQGEAGYQLRNTNKLAFPHTRFEAPPIAPAARFPQRPTTPLPPLIPGI